MNPGTISGLVTGALFGGLNLWFLVRIVRAMTSGEKTRKGKMALFLFGKMALLFVTIGLILWRGYVTPLPFLGGFTLSFVAGIVWIIFRGLA